MTEDASALIDDLCICDKGRTWTCDHCDEQADITARLSASPAGREMISGALGRLAQPAAHPDDRAEILTRLHELRAGS